MTVVRGTIAVLLAVLLVHTFTTTPCAAFSIPKTSVPKSSTTSTSTSTCSPKDGRTIMSETPIRTCRSQNVVLVSSIFAVMTTFGTMIQPPVASASLLEQFGTDPNSKDFNTKVVTTPPALTTKSSADTVQIDPTLRGSYYYPTAKKRYLPRIQKVTNELSQVPDAILNDDWETVRAFAKVAENAILPLQLYQSSLDGQGLSMNNNYAKIMKQDALEYEKQYKLFEKAIGKRDKDAALSTVTNMAVAVADYRQQGRLRDDDGNIPSVDEIKRMTMRKPTIPVNRPN